MAKENLSLLIYQTPNGALELKNDAENETIWANLDQIAMLFGRDKSTISRHIKNIFQEEELIKEATVAFFATVQMEGARKVKREIEYFNLDMIISIGYRVNSKTATQFRQWATQTLKQHITQGFTINPKRLEHKKQQFLQTIEEKAAHLLYFTIKNRPFNDGNKRSGAFAFIWFLQKSAYDFRSKIHPETLATLTILIAESNPQEKDKMIGIVLLLLQSQLTN
jgi:prophage maintenance system killer protein